MEKNAIIEKNAEDRGLQLEDAMRGHVELRESIKSRFGLDPETIEWKKAPRTKGFWSKLEEACGEKLREGIGNSSSSLGQLLRYGVQQFMFDAYKDVPVIYPDVVAVRPSSNRQEWYAPLYGAELPQDVAPGGKFEDSRLQGLDTVVINKKVGRVITIERELFDDDQTGQLVDRASKIGKRARYKEEFDVMAAIRGGTYSTTIGNAFASNTALSQLALENADIALQAIRDPLGNRMLVMPGYLLTDPSNKFNAAKLLNSALQPSVPGASGENIAVAPGVASGGTGWTMTVNPLQGLYQLGVSRFLGSGDWFLMEPKTSLVFQERDPLEILQEAPNAGQSFENDAYRFRVRRRYQAALLESRYIFKGSINATAPTI
jgi:hypothetical protein